MDDIIIEQDLATGTSYWTLSDAPVDHSRRISDSIDSTAGEPHSLSVLETAELSSELPKRFFMILYLNSRKGQFALSSARHV